MYMKQNPSDFKDNPKNHLLHNPSDRGLYIFEGERECAYALRLTALKFSLVIVCPLMLKDGTHWDRLWDAQNRPPIIARWSTGMQALHRPLVLGCLPNPTFEKDRYKRDVSWF